MYESIQPRHEEIRAFLQFLQRAQIQIASTHCAGNRSMVRNHLKSLVRGGCPTVTIAPGWTVSAKLVLRLIEIGDRVRYSEALSPGEADYVVQAVEAFRQSESVAISPTGRAPLPEQPTGRPTKPFGWTSFPSYPRVWGLLQYLFPHKARRDTFEPSHQQMLADYYTSMKKYRTPLSRGWLRFCFAFRTVLMLVECYRVLGFYRVARLVPERVRRWWIG